MSQWFLWGLILGLGALIFWARKSGKDAVKTKMEKDNADAAKRISKGKESAPSNPNDLERGLRDGSWKL